MQFLKKIPIFAGRNHYVI